MANVLPKDALSAVRKSYRARFVLMGSFVSIICGSVALLALMPAYAIVSAGRDSTEDQSSVSLPPSLDRDEIVRAQTLVRELRPVATSTTSIIEVLSGIFDARPVGVKVSGVSYTPGEEGTILVSGTASSRDGINSYRTALAQDVRFKNVSVPIGILTGSGGGNFTITLSGVF